MNEYLFRRKTRIKSAANDRQSMRRGSVQSLPTPQKKEQEVYVKPIDYQTQKMNEDFYRPKPAPPDSSAIRRMQNRWEAETQQREAAAAKAQVPKTTPAGRARDRWGASSDSQTSSVESNRSTQQQPPSPAVDNQTVPSSRFTRPPPLAEPVEPPLTHSAYDQQQPQSPRANETKGFSRPPLVHQKSSGGAVEALTRQISLSSMGGNDASTSNGQPTILVKDAKVTPSTELHGAVTRAKDSKFDVLIVKG